MLGALFFAGAAVPFLPGVADCFLAGVVEVELVDCCAATTPSSTTPVNKIVCKAISGFLMPLLSHWRINGANPRDNIPRMAGIKSSVKPHSNQKLVYSALAVLLLSVLIAGCVISPRRLVNESPSPTPTPDISPTPTPSTTPTPTPTPTGMAATVPQTAEFLFLSDATAPFIFGFKINPDGLLEPIQGSPFAIASPGLDLKSLHNFLIVKTAGANAIFIVDKEKGTLQPADPANSSVMTSQLSGAATAGSSHAVLDATSKFMYVIDREKAELRGYKVNNGKLSELAAPYSVSAGISSMAIVRP